MDENDILGCLRNICGALRMSKEFMKNLPLPMTHCIFQWEEDLTKELWKRDKQKDKKEGERLERYYTMLHEEFDRLQNQ